MTGYREITLSLASSETTTTMMMIVIVMVEKTEIVSFGKIMTKERHKNSPEIISLLQAFNRFISFTLGEP